MVLARSSPCSFWRIVYRNFLLMLILYYSKWMMQLLYSGSCCFGCWSYSVLHFRATQIARQWPPRKKLWSLNHHRLLIHLSLLGWPWVAPSPASTQWNGLWKILVPERGQGSCSFMSDKRSHLFRPRVSSHSSIQICTFSCSCKACWHYNFAWFYVVGNYVPVDQVRDDIASAYEKEVECEAQNMLLMYKNMCNGKVRGFYSRQHFLFFVKFHSQVHTQTE